MDLAAIRVQLDAERRTLAREGEIIDVLPGVSRLRASDGAGHCVIFSSLWVADAQRTIADQVAHYRGLGVGFEWKVYSHDGPPDLLDRLSRSGFSVGPKEAVLVLDLGDPPEWIRLSAAGNVMRVESAEQICLFRAAAESIFGKDYGVTAGQLERAIRSNSTHHLAYVAMVDGIAAGIGRLYTHPNSAFGGLYGGATRAAYRGRGLYRGVVAARARDAIKLGASYLIVDALPTSRPILERLGFRHFADTWPCEWRP